MTELRGETKIGRLILHNNQIMSFISISLYMIMIMIVKKTPWIQEDGTHINQVVILSLDGTTAGPLDYVTRAWCNHWAFPVWAKAKQGVTWNVTKTWPTPHCPATAAAPGPTIL